MATATPTVTVSTLSKDIARDTARGTSKFAAAECEITFAKAKPIKPMIATISTGPNVDHGTDPTNQASRPVAPIPSPIAIPPATNHSTGQSNFFMSSPFITFRHSSVTTGKKPTIFDDTPCSDSVIHSKMVVPATM